MAATAVLAGTSQLGGLPLLTPSGLAVWGGVALVNATLASAFGYYGWLTDEQSAARKEAIVELNTANTRLAAAMAENETLQAQLVASARDAGVHDERERLAREIHDTIAQGLAGIVAQLQAARSGADRERHLDTAAELARSTLVEGRRSVQALRPEALVGSRLPDALADVASRWSRVSGVPAAVTTTGTARQLHPEVEIALLRTGQEALANVGKHAGASRVGVTLSYMEDVVTLAIEAGATGYLLKDARSDELFRAVRAAARGDAVLSPSVATRLPGSVRRPAREPLSAREQEVLELVARGATNREAARQLFVSEATVKTHLLHVYAKLGVNDRAAAVAEGFQRGLLIPDRR